MVAIILSRPENEENIGLIARAMKNTGFKDLRLAAAKRPGAKAYKTGIHAGDILAAARLFPRLEDAVADLDVVFAATARPRKNFPTMSLADAVAKVGAFPVRTRIGFLFGNERTGLTSEEIFRSNFRFTIPQASRQPSYNLAAAVLLTLFHLFARSSHRTEEALPRPLPRRDQDDFVEVLIRVLSNKGFIHRTNERHIAEMVYSLFGRLTLTDKDRKLLLAIFSKGADARPLPLPRPGGGPAPRSAAEANPVKEEPHGHEGHVSDFSRRASGRRPL